MKNHLEKKCALKLRRNVYTFELVVQKKWYCEKILEIKLFTPDVNYNKL